MSLFRKNGRTRIEKNVCSVKILKQTELPAILVENNTDEGNGALFFHL